MKYRRPHKTTNRFQEVPQNENELQAAPQNEQILVRGSKLDWLRKVIDTSDGVYPITIIVDTLGPRKECSHQPAASVHQACVALLPHLLPALLLSYI